MKGGLPIFEKAQALVAELTAMPTRGAQDDGFLAPEARMLEGAKKVAVASIGLAAQKHGQDLQDQQEVLGHFADITLQVYALESALLRAQKKAGAVGAEKAALQEDAVRCFAQDAMDRIEASGRRVLAAVEEGDTLRTYLAALKRFTKREFFDTVAPRRRIADAALEAGAYPLG